jgi:opacity protein-like surface antigen
MRCPHTRSPRLLAIAGVVVLLFSAAPSRAADQPTLRIGRVNAPPRLDDFASGRIPEGYAAVTEFRQREPRDGEPASQATTAYAGYDDRNLYIVFVCRQDPSALRAHLVRREAVFGDDIVGVLLDTYRDRRRSYAFIVNPLGVQMDGISSEASDDDWSFDTLWHSGGRVTDDGFVTWLAIPFRSLRFADARTQTWGISFARILPATNETVFWPYMTRKIQGFGEQMATLEGLERISPGRNLQFIPYSAGTAARFLDEPAAAYSSRSDGRIGLDAKAIVKDAITLDFTLNPDFSQIESDEPQVTINQRYEVFFPEKRPFFIENATMFVTPETLFFSRRVVDPQFGGRITGKIGRWAIAGVVSDDRAPGQSPGGVKRGSGDRAVIGVARATREFAAQSQAGVMVTTRQVGSTSNTVASVDTRIPFTKNWAVSGQAAVSETREASGGASTSGRSVYGSLGYTSRNVRFRANYLERSPGFRSDVGYIPRVDIRRLRNYSSYTWFTKRSRLQSFGPGVEAYVIWDHQGRVQDWTINPEFSMSFPASTNLSIAASRTYERFSGADFHKSDVNASVGTEWFRWLSANVSYQAGEAINYYPAAGLAPSLGDATEASLGLTVKPSSRLQIGETYIYNRLQTKAATTELPAPVDIFNLHLWRTKASLQFTRELSLRAIVDYNGVLPNATLVGLSRSKRVTADVLVTYLLNPGTALYIGYNDQYANVRVDPLVSPVLRATASPTTSVGRQVFVKVSYLLRY